MTSNVFQKLKKSLADLYQEKLVDVILYGSHARGTATTDSDIDIVNELQAELVLNNHYEPVYLAFIMVYIMRLKLC